MTRRARISAAAHEKVLDTTERIGAFFLEQFVAQTQEVVYQLCLDAKGRMICCRKVSEGDVAGVGLNLRRIVENALRCNAVLVPWPTTTPAAWLCPPTRTRSPPSRSGTPWRRWMCTWWTTSSWPTTTTSPSAHEGLL